MSKPMQITQPQLMSNRCQTYFARNLFFI
uniref:Uncharacterized protein n=1 Tax=Rhizophora mucronata TaxID=61149 RepID=A0A2P2NQ59_RHIMU